MKQRFVNLLASDKMEETMIYILYILLIILVFNFIFIW